MNLEICAAIQADYPALAANSNNPSTNVLMLAINQKLGFERSDMQIQFETKFNQT